MGDAVTVPRLRVLHIINDLDRGGAELALCRLVMHPITCQWLESTVVCLKGEGPLVATMREAGIAVRVVGMNSLMNLPLALWHLNRTISVVKPDIVQTWLYHSDLLGGVLSRMRRVPVVWGVRTTNLGAGNAYATRIVRWLCARLSGRVPVAIVYAADAAREAHERAGYRALSAYVIRNGVQTFATDTQAAQREAMRRRLGIADNELVIGWVGRNNPDKDVPTFLKALSLVLARHPQVRVVMIGRGLGPEQEAAFANVLGRQGATRLILMGEQEKVQACYPAFDVFVLSSRTEAFPNVLAEAMAAGVPSISTDVGDARWVLGAGGLIVPAANSQAMAEALHEMISQPALREAQARQARERALTTHSMNVWATAFVETYRNALGLL